MDESNSHEELNIVRLMEMLDPEKDGWVTLDRLCALASKLKKESRDKQNTVRRASIELLKATVLLAIIILVGIFSFIELEHSAYEEKITANQLLRADIKKAFPMNESTVIDILNLTSHYDAELDETVRAVYENYSNQTLWHQLEDNGLFSTFAFKNPWKFENAAWYVFTIITTIGYGQVVPITTGGYFFVIIYSIPAIIVMAYFIRQLIDFYRSCPCKIVSLKFQAMTIPIFFVLYLGISGWLFSLVEGWKVTEGIYFSWVTISTIGFGDFFIDDLDWWQVLICIFLILNGLFLFSYVLAVSGNILEHITQPERWREVFNSTKFARIHAMSKLIPLGSRSISPRSSKVSSIGGSDSGSYSEHGKRVSL